LAFWIIDAVLDSLFFFERPFLDLLILNIPEHEIYIRIAILGIFSISGFVISGIISRHQKTEKLLQESEKISHSFINATTDSVFLIDVEGTVMDINQPAAENLGKSRKEILSKNIYDFFPPSVAVKRKEFLEVIIQSKKALRIEDEREGFWFDTIAYPIVDETGQISRVIIISHNITTRKKAEEELRQYEQIVSSSTDMMALLDDQFKYLAANKAYMDAFNLTPERMAGQTVSTLFGEKFFQTIIKPHAEKCLSGKMVNYQDWFDFPNFGKKYMDISYSPYIDKDSNLKGFVVIARNITDRKEAEDKLINSNFWLEESQRVSKIGSYIFDIPKNEWTSSKTLNDIFGITESLKKDIATWVKIVHPEQKEEMLDYFQKEVLGKHAPFNKEYRIVRIKDQKTRWVHGLGEVSYDENNNPLKMLGTIQDITSRKKAEMQLKKSEKELQKLTAHLQTVREEERTMVAHELHDNIGQSLSALKMDIYMLKKKCPGDQHGISDQLEKTNNLLDSTIQTTRKMLIN